ncbi:MAG TPA: CHASE2 domain-containing protein, partial [Rhizobiaceae bacterium]
MRFFRSPGSIGVAVARLAGLALLLALLGLRVADPLFVSGIRNQGFDIFQRIHPRPTVKQPITIVDIDEKSLELVGQWPWPRSEVARLIDRLTGMGAVVVGFDVVFAEPDRLSPDRIAADNPDLPEGARADLLRLPSNEEVLASAIGRSRVVVGETSVRVDDETLVGSGQPIPDVPHAALGGDPTPFLLKFPRLVQNLPVIS